MLGSDIREDKCRQCGGDGTTCNTLSGVLDTQDLQLGYNDILLIPAGATNIHVQERAPSTNYLGNILIQVDLLSLLKSFTF